MHMGPKLEGPKCTSNPLVMLLTGTPTLKQTTQDDGKGGLGSRGVAFMTVSAVLTVLAVLKSTLPSFCLSCKIQCRETTVTVLTVLAVSAVVAVLGVTATPP